jgi:putative transposase
MNEYRSKGITVTRMLYLLGIPESTYYRKRSMIHLKRGRKNSLTTCLSMGNDIVRIPDAQILLVIEELLGREFVCYGYKKVTKYLQKSGYIINRKKVFRIMKENNLLNVNAG